MKGTEICGVRGRYCIKMAHKSKVTMLTDNSDTDPMVNTNSNLAIDFS